MASSSQSLASKRLLKELSENRQRPNPCLRSLGPVSDNDLLHWRATLLGPIGTAYEGCEWELDIVIPEQYPHQPPAVRFLTPVCHPNVHLKKGEICLDLLKDKWSGTYTISQTLSAIQHLLAHPEPDSPLNVDAAAVLRNGDTVGYESLVRVWGVLYAGKRGTVR